MRIGIDTREAHSPHPTGKGMWTKKICEELQSQGVEIVPFEGANTLLWHLHTARKLRKEKPCDLYLAPTSFIVPFLLGHAFPHAIVVHDLIAFDNEPHNRKAKLIERLTLPRALKTAKHIFTVSEATKQDLLERFPWVDAGKIVTVYEGPTVTCHGSSPLTMTSSLSSRACHSERQPGRSRTGGRGTRDDKGYILSIGTLCPRKNQLRLINAFNALPHELRHSTKLILAGGRGWQDADIIRLSEESENVEWRGYVDDLTSLLANAKCLAYPSLKEGFGLPVLDAMTLGVPILTSNRSSMKEIAGDAAVLVNPESEEELSEGLKNMLTNKDLRQGLAEKGRNRAGKFSWKKTVNLVIEAMVRGNRHA